MNTEQKHEIDISGLPEGYRAVAYRIGEIDECCLDPRTGEILKLFLTTDVRVIIVEKIQPRRIVLEETGEVRRPKEGEYVFNNGNLCLCRKPERWGNEHQIWRTVEEE